MNECLFCKIVAGEMTTPFVHQSAQVVAFADIAPVAPVHLLIIPTQHIASMNDMDERHADILAEMLLTATALAKEKGIAESGYKLLIRTGRDGGQEVPHVHLHLMGGTPLAESMKMV